MKVSKDILSGLLYCAAGIGLAYCVLFTAAFMYIGATEGAQGTQDFCVDIVKAFEGEKGR